MAQEVRHAAEPGNEEVRRAGSGSHHGGAAHHGGDDSAGKVVNWGRRAGDKIGQMGEREMRQTAEMTQRQSERWNSFARSATKAYLDIAEVSREDIETLLKSGTRLAQGWQEWNSEFGNFAQQSLRLGTQLANNLLTSRTVDDMVHAQQDFVKDSLEVMVNGSSRLLVLSSKLASDTAAPISECLAKTTETITDRMADQQRAASQLGTRTIEDLRETRH